MNSSLGSIISITLNPALDLGGVVDQLLPNEKNYVHEETRFPGGNAINAARIIHRLGAPVIVSGLLGRGVGSEIRDLLEAEGLRHEFIPIGGPARISVTVSARESHHQTRLSFSGPTISLKEYGCLLDFIRRVPKGALVILGGSLPPGIESTQLQEIISMLNAKECECVVDVPGPVLQKICNEQSSPLLIKPNLVEFQQLLGTNITTCEEVILAARTFTDRIPLVCVSSVQGGAVLVTANHSWFGRTPKVNVRTSVGAGDSMVGGICTILRRWKVTTRHDPRFLALLAESGDDLLRWGLAAACATLTVQGTQLGNAEEIAHFIQQIQIQRL